MALFSNMKSGGDRTILDRMENFYTDSVTMSQQYWAEADLDTRFYCGDQTIWSELYGNAPALARKQYNFNRIRRIIEMVGGYQRKNRKSTIVIPVENADQETADQFTKTLSWINRRENVYHTISEAFTGSLITGMNFLQLWMDYREDPISGDIKVSNCAYNQIMVDPFFRKQDLSDCNAIWKRTFLTRSQVASLLPDRSEELHALYQQYNKDGKFQYLPENFSYDNNTNLMVYDEFFYRDYRDQRIIVDKQSGETMEWTGREEELKEYLQAFPTVTSLLQKIPTTKLAIVCQGQVMYDGPNPMGIDEFPFVPVLTYYTPELPYFQNRLQGMVRGMRDSQYLYNRRKIIELDILESQLNSGYILKEGTVIDPMSVYKTGQGQVLWLKKDAQMTDIQQIQAPQIPPTQLQASEILGREIQEVSGVNEELLGSATDDKAGILSMLRQGAGLTTLQRLFDQLDLSQKLLGKLMIKAIQANFTPGKVRKIVEGEPSMAFYNKNFGIYDAAVEEGFDTTTQKQMQFAQLLHLREVGVPIPASILLKASTLQNKEELVRTIEEQEQQQMQMQQAESEIQMQQQQATLEMAQARAAADRGMAEERISRVAENQTLAEERKAEAEKDKTQSLLNFIKALKELETMDIDNIAKTLELHGKFKENVNTGMPAMPPAMPENNERLL